MNNYNLKYILDYVSKYIKTSKIVYHITYTNNYDINTVTDH